MDTPREVNNTRIGAITAEIEVVTRLYMEGVPVWLVRAPSEFLPTTNIVNKCWPSLPRGMVSEYLPKADPIFNSSPSAIRNRACQGLRAHNIRLGHSACTPGPGALQENSNATAVPLAPQQAAPTLSTGPTVPFSFGPAHRTVSTERKFAADYFKPLSSSVAPGTNSMWQNALSSVNRKWNRVLDHPNLDRLRGYPMLDPSQLMKTENKRSLLYIPAWLVIRIAWLHNTTSRPPSGNTSAASTSAGPATLTNRFPATQEWRDYLASVLQRLGLLDPPSASSLPNTTPASTTSSSEPPSKRRKTEPHSRKITNDALSALFSLDLQQIHGPVDIFWKGSVLIDAQAILARHFDVPQHVVKEIVWDLFEHNFRLEFLALDRCILPREYMSKRAAEEREAQLARCFPQRSFVVVDLPRHDEGLGASAWADRVEYVEEFRKALSVWQGSSAKKLSEMTVLYRGTNGFQTVPEKDVREVERVAYLFYCQTFFDYFGRAPSIPRILPLKDA